MNERSIRKKNRKKRRPANLFLQFPFYSFNHSKFSFGEQRKKINRKILFFIIIYFQTSQIAVEFPFVFSNNGKNVKKEKKRTIFSQGLHEKFSQVRVEGASDTALITLFNESRNKNRPLLLVAT